MVHLVQYQYSQYNEQAAVFFSTNRSVYIITSYKDIFFICVLTAVFSVLVYNEILNAQTVVTHQVILAG